MSTTQRAAFALMVGLLGSCLSLPAQETQGGIQGTVKDASGGAVPNATIEISGPALFGTRKIQTDSAGAYRFSQLPPGDYTITVSASGFATIKQPGIHADVGRLPSIDVTLEVVRLRRRWRLAKPLRLWTSRRVKWPSMSRKMSSIMFPRAG